MAAQLVQFPYMVARDGAGPGAEPSGQQARGDGPAGRPWRVAIESPESTAAGPMRVIELRDRAVATSGDYRNFYRNLAVGDGARRSHVIDPVTGAPVGGTLASASVAHRSAMWADGYATLLFVLGPERALAFAETHGLAVFLVMRGRGGLETRASAAMGPLLSP